MSKDTSATTKSKQQQSHRRRAYIGNLRSRPTLSPTTLYNSLFAPHCLSVHDTIDGITLIHQHHNSNAFALVEFKDVGYAIEVLNGVTFDGRVLRVSKEKTTNHNFGGSNSRGRSGGGFGSSQWAGSSNSNGGKNNRQVIKNKPKQQNNGQVITAQPAKTNRVGQSVEEEQLDKEEVEATTIINEIESTTISTSEIEQNFQTRCQLPLSDLLAEYGEQDLDWDKKHPPPQQQLDTTTTTDTSTAATAAGAVQSVKKGENDIDFQTRCQLPLSDLLDEYGEQDLDWMNQQKKEQHHHPRGDDNYMATKQNNNARYDTTTPKAAQSSNTILVAKDSTTTNDTNNGMLAHYNKASIHLNIVSFGYKYGAPSHSKRGFTYAHPLPPIDIRDLCRSPGNVGKFNGLHYLVKRALLNPTSTTATTAKNSNHNDDDDDDEIGEERSSSTTTTTTMAQSPMRNRANDIADEVIKILVEAIDEGGHGPLSPLSMQISIGSEYGRHRAVALVEHLGVILRARLRKNDGQCFNNDNFFNSNADTRVDNGSNNNTPPVVGKKHNNGIVQELVSVSTKHDHIDARHVDEEAYCTDLQRRERKEEKKKKNNNRRQQDLGWGDVDDW